VQNLFRAVELGLNSYIIRCRDTGMVTDPGSIYAYGGPILLLCFQIVGLFFLTMYIEGVSMSWFNGKAETSISDHEKTASSGRADVDAETARVEASESDLLRVLHISKRFGANHAVEDLSFGLRTGEIMALLGPNGAGKTTTINMIRGDMSPSSGHIYLEGVDTHADTRLAQGNLGGESKFIHPGCL
jgi:ATP-binding cassette, subfamily A (ABC1), member 3